MPTPDDILRFWFVEHGQDNWSGGRQSTPAELDYIATEGMF
ncbi:MAG: hypothetical protein Q8L54_07890 [Devosia sp.]|nr:hypothetical protein [Devosia sp.]